MALPLSTTELISSLEDSEDIVSWINDTLTPPDAVQPVGLTDLDQHVTHLVSTLDLACEDTSSQLERIIDDVSHGVPRLTYDLHFMKDGASSLQSVLVQVTERSRDVVPPSTRAAIDKLQLLDSIKSRMEAAREVLREAESWSTLELEVTSLLAEKSYAKAAERLSEASRSMAVFQNTPEYDPRKTLMVNLQNQLEAALSSALRESEFRNYYNGSRRASVVAVWQDARLIDCEPVSSVPDHASQTLADFVPKFYGSFLSLLKVERTSIPSIFPDPAQTLSTLISSVLSALQPTFSQRLAAIFSHYGDSALKELIPVFQSTEEFASGVDNVMEKIKYSAPSLSEGPPGHSRRRSTRLSMSWRVAPNRSTSNGLGIPRSSLTIPDDLEWEQELFQPFLDFQVEYGTLERRLLDHSLRDIISNDTRDRIPDSDRARLLRERAVDIFSVAEESVSRCTAFTHGYGAVGLVRALDGFFQSFIDMWTADVRMGASTAASISPQSVSGEDFSDLDYTSEDWSDFQLSLHLLSSARAVFDRMMVFENKLRSNLAHIATTFRLARNDPSNFVIANSKGESQLLEQSSLNSAELHALLERVEHDPAHSIEVSLPPSSTAGLRHGSHPVSQQGLPAPLLVDAREGVFTFAKACQISLQGTLLSPLRKYLASYSSSPSGHFSLSPSETVHKISEGLLNLPRLFDVYADDDALSFSLHTLPHIDPDLLKLLREQSSPDPNTAPGHKRRQSLTAPKLTPAPMDPELVSSTWLSSLGHTLLTHLTTSVLPNISTLSAAGAAQLASDLGYLSTIIRAINVEFEDLDKWREYADLDDEEGKKRMAGLETDIIFQNIARMRGWANK
ncbi:Golgi complex component 7-domain-containing protein [Mycena sp. CBHHK59/15]|nr:Golgi complex component 7-domain-containing protein [Mycena sp. CBHHK59/15]